jgi:hypothetical protein
MKLLLRMLFLEARKLESARISVERSRFMTVRPTGQVRSYLPARESLDGNGAADHDSPYTFGRSPRSLAPFPFSTRQYARLLVLRGRFQAGLLADDLCTSGTTRNRW